MRFWRSSAFEDRLLDDLRREGIIIPVLVWPKPNSGHFEVVDGLTRVRNARLLGERTVLCQVLHCDRVVAYRRAFKVQSLRRPPDSMGLARHFKLLHDEFGLKYKDIMVEYGYKSRSWVSKLVALNDLPVEYQEAVAKGDLSVEDGYSIVSGDRHVLEHVDERRKVGCQVCGVPHDRGELVSLRICRDCEHGFHAYRAESEKGYKEAMERAAKRLREKQTELIE